MRRPKWDEPLLLSELSRVDARRLDLRPRPGGAQRAIVERAEAFPGGHTERLDMPKDQEAGIAFTLNGQRSRPSRARPSGRSPSPRHRDPAPLLLARAGLPRRRQLPRLHGRDRGRAGARRLLHPHARRGHGGRHRLGTRGPRRARMVFELLVADQPARARRTTPIPSSGAGPRRSASRTAASRPSRDPAADPSHPAMRSISTPASTARSASGPAARSRSTT